MAIVADPSPLWSILFPTFSAGSLWDISSLVILSGALFVVAIALIGEERVRVDLLPIAFHGAASNLFAPNDVNDLTDEIFALWNRTRRVIRY